MKPEEVAKYRAEKIEKERRETEEREQAQAAERAQKEAQAALARDAITDKIVPYLTEVKAATNGALTFNVLRDTDNAAVGVDLQIDGHVAKIRRSGESFQLNIRDRQEPGDFSPFHGIQSASDISDESLGRFIKAIMDAP
jgi:hypothetical protein